MLTFTLVGLMLAATEANRAFDPEALKEFSLEVLQRGREFSRESRIAVSINQVISVGISLWLCFSQVGARLMTWMERLGGRRLWLSLGAVVGGLTLIGFVVDLPFAYYLGHYHEKQYGLTGGSPQGWFIDHTIGLALDVLLGFALWVVLYWLIRRWPKRWWAPASLVYLGFTGVLALLSPILFLPMTGEITRLNDLEMRAMIERLADRAGVEVEEVYVLKVSDKTSRINAMVTGIGKTKGIYFYDTLLKQFTADEVEVVLAHELSHAANHDVVRGWLTQVTCFTISLAIAGWALRESVDRGPMSLPSPHAPRGLALISLMLTLTGHITHPVQNVQSRIMEVRADQFAVTVTKNPEAFVSGFKKLAQGNPGDVDPPYLVEFLTHSHPSVVSRMRAAKDVLK